jgi:uroporphyrinogen decarboxylase
MSLKDLMETCGGRPVIPLLGSPGARLTDTSLKQNAFNPVLHAGSIQAIADRFEPDAVFLMMDLSLEAGALGLSIQYPLYQPPTVQDHPVRSLQDLEGIRKADILDDVRIQGHIKALELLGKTLDIPKGVYVSGPFTLAGLLMGTSEVAIATITEPDFLHCLVEFCKDICLRYAKALEDAGADIIAILEPTATLLSPESFSTFCGGYVQGIIRELSPVSVLHVCGAASHLIKEMAATGADGLSLDAPVDLCQAAREVPPDVVVIGNIDPVRVITQESPEGVSKATRELVDEMRPHRNFILSTGCDIPYEAPFPNIDAFMKEGRL